MFMSLLTGMVTVSSRPQPGEVSERTGRARLCAYVKHPTLNSKFCHRTRIAPSEGRGQGQGNKLCLAGPCPCESLHSNGSDKKKNAFHGILHRTKLPVLIPVDATSIHCLYSLYALPPATYSALERYSTGWQPYSLITQYIHLRYMCYMGIYLMAMTHEWL